MADQMSEAFITFARSGDYNTRSIPTCLNREFSISTGRRFRLKSPRHPRSVPSA
jgi:hypothetical protein